MAGLVVTSLPAAGQTPTSFSAGAAPLAAYGFQGEGEARVDNVDARAGRVAPTAGQRALAERLGASDPRWNDFGTPHVLINHEGTLSAPREGDAAVVARDFLRENAELFRLDAGRVDALELVKDVPLHDSPDLARVYGGDQGPRPEAAENSDVAHVVTFTQTFDGLETARGGHVAVGVKRDGSVAYLTSTVTGDAALSGSENLSAAEAIQAAAADPEVGLDVGTLTPATPDAGMSAFTSDTLADVQRAQLVALPTPQDGVRRVWGVTLLDTSIDEHGNPNAFVSFVDAETGRIWQRTNKVEHLAQGAGVSTVTLPQTGAPALTQAAPSGGAFSGNTGDDNGCGAPSPIDVPAGTGQITISVMTNDPDNDLVAEIVFEGEPVASGDTLGNPEAATYAPPADTLPAEDGQYAARACNFVSSDPGFAYEGSFVLTPVGVPAPGGDNGGVDDPTWKVFPANPPFVSGELPEDVDSSEQDTRELWCWDSDRKDSCDEQQRNSASRVPWDVNAPANAPSFTTDGNNASTAISQFSFVTPDSVGNRPVSTTREYEFPWDNSWFENSCNPTNFGTVADDRNDEQAATANLFVQHNRMHDWSYFLGFTEVNSNLQKNNFGNTGPELENDPELGSSQAGRTTAAGRNNANQITLSDGIAPITNQYLWQPIAGVFYAPCVDGAYDQAVVAHEYGHAITNRMIGGDELLGGTGATQGQSESWSDLQFAAYFTEFVISAGEGVNPYVLGPYVTGNEESGIRNYAMNDSPLNYSDLDYDPNGLGSPHANGEIWSATNFDILTSLSEKYDEDFPADDEVLQNACARGQKAAEDCPGNRRWNQIQYDSYLIQPSGASMVDSRDGMLAADMLRFDGANQDELWDAFAKRGLGESATATGAGDVESVPGFDSPLRDDEAEVTFTAPDGVRDMEVFVGPHEARAVPVADTVEDTEVTDTTTFVPGAYEFIAVAPGFGAQRFTLELEADDERSVEVPLRRNVASASNGAEVTGDGVNLEQIIDDTEETNWASLESEGTASEGKEEGAQVEGRQVTVDLAGSDPVDVREVQVSALLRGPAGTEDEEELPADPGNQSRFSALRSFDILACSADCEDAESFTEIFSSDDDAFPAIRPRPTISKLNLRPFDVTDTEATHLRLVVRDNQCTGGPDYQGEKNPDDDPNFNPDCDTLEQSNDRDLPIGPVGFGVPPSPPRPLDPPFDIVRAAELQVFSTTADDNPTIPAPDEPGTDRPGTDEPGTDEPGTDEPGTDEPGTDEPGSEDPDSEDPDSEDPDSEDPDSDGTATPRARGITEACPEDRVPPNARDDDDGNLHEPSIDCMVWYDIAEGTSATMYEPFKDVSREQMASFVARLIERSGGELPESPEDAFIDDEGSVHELNINKLAAVGVVDGKGGEIYDPKGVVGRDQMAKFLVQAYEHRSPESIVVEGDYFDDDDGNTHEVNINKSAAAGFTNGRNGGYDPKAFVKRDQMASFLARTLDLLVDEGTAQAKQ